MIMKIYERWSWGPGLNMQKNILSQHVAEFQLRQELAMALFTLLIESCALLVGWQNFMEKRNDPNLFAGTNGRSNWPGKMLETHQNQKHTTKDPKGMQFVFCCIFYFYCPFVSILLAMRTNSCCKGTGRSFPWSQDPSNQKDWWMSCQAVLCVKKDWNWETPMDIIYT